MKKHEVKFVYVILITGAVGLLGWNIAFCRNICLLLLLLYPLAGLIMLYRNRESPLQGFTLLLPAALAAIGAIYPIEILDYDRLWEYCAIASIVFLVLMIICGFKSIMSSPQLLGTVLIMLGTSCAYALGVVLFVNSNLSYRDAVTYRVKVVDKQEYRGKGNSYFLFLSPWGPVTEESSQHVTQRFYNAVKVDDAISIIYRPGNLGIRWYTFEK